MKTILLKTFFLGVVLFSAGQFSSAQTTNLPLVSVTGKGEVKVAPDEVVIRFGVVNMGATPEQARRGVDSIFK
ncbi:MAG TPA: SIMPL domain-containing protein, partial [Patescibacteria group bacterium]|nr:SIMPL domain-containing protein [Patescibacteria group bacterium]